MSNGAWLTSVRYCYEVLSDARARLFTFLVVESLVFSRRLEDRVRETCVVRQAREVGHEELTRPALGVDGLHAHVGRRPQADCEARKAGQTTWRADSSAGRQSIASAHTAS